MARSEVLRTEGLVDLHVHLREPSTNNSETIASGTRAALLGGFVLINDMPNNPGNPTWSEGAMLEKHAIALNEAYIPVGFYAGWQPDTQEELIELAKMSKLAVGLKLYGAPTTGNDQDYSATDFLPAVKTWHTYAPDKPIMFHAGKDNLQDMVYLVAEHFEHPLHICHVNSSRQIAAVRLARQHGLEVTCGVCPHHLIKTSHDVHSEGWFARMQPPLVDQAEAERLMYHLANGDIDVIETDHAPHPEEAKWRAERENPAGIHDPDHTTCFGVPGIEFAAPLMFYQAKRGRIAMERLVEAMSTKPAEIIGVKLQKRTKITWRMDEYRIEESESEAPTPYRNKLARGIVESVHIAGRAIYRHGQVVDPASRVVMNRREII